MSGDDADGNVYQLHQPEDLLAAYRNRRPLEIDDVISKVKAAIEAAARLEHAEARAAEWLPHCGDPRPPRLEALWVAGIMLKDGLNLLEEAKKPKPGKVLP